LKKILLASTLLAAMTGLASAADLPSRMAPPVYAPPPLPTFTWTGAYFGINAGYAFDHEGRFRTLETFPGATTTNVTASSDGFTGGGQIGYNYEFGGFGGFGGAGSGIVVGIEADAAYTDLNQNRTVGFAGVAAPASLFGTTTTFRSGLDYLGTVRGRVGYAFGQFLIYGTGGFAYGGVDDRITINDNAGTIAAFRRNRMETGYTYGGGIEYALPTNSFLNFFKSSAVTIKAEYLHYDLGRTNIAFNNGAGIAGTTRVSNEGDLARVGLNYKFGSY
jgi:outer membrane immunogenic protein